jgi:hypothetical protein
MQPGYPGYGYYGGMPMGPQKSTAPKTLGVCSMSFGAIVAVISLFNLATGGKGFTGVQPSQQEAFDRYLDAVHGTSLVISLMMFVMSVALFVVGTGQRGYKRWAVGASQIWGITAIVVFIVNATLQFTVILPALTKFIDEISHGSSAAAPIANAMKFGFVIGLALYLPYPFILIAAFRKPAVREAMDQPPKPTPAADVF